MTRHLIGDYMLHEGKAPAPDVKGPWYSLDHDFVMEAGFKTPARADQRQAQGRAAEDSAFSLATPMPHSSMAGTAGDRVIYFTLSISRVSSFAATSSRTGPSFTEPIGASVSAWRASDSRAQIRRA